MLFRSLSNLCHKRETINCSFQLRRIRDDLGRAHAGQVRFCAKSDRRRHGMRIQIVSERWRADRHAGVRSDRACPAYRASISESKLIAGIRMDVARILICHQDVDGFERSTARVRQPNIRPELAGAFSLSAIICRKVGAIFSRNRLHRQSKGIP